MKAYVILESLQNPSWYIHIHSSQDPTEWTTQRIFQTAVASVEIYLWLSYFDSRAIGMDLQNSSHLILNPRSSILQKMAHVQCESLCHPKFYPLQKLFTKRKDFIKEDINIWFWTDRRTNWRTASFDNLRNFHKKGFWCRIETTTIAVVGFNWLK